MKKLGVITLVLTTIMLSIGVSAVCIPGGMPNTNCDISQCCGYTGVWTSEQSSCWYGQDLWINWCYSEGGQNCPSQTCWVSAIDADLDGYNNGVDCDDTNPLVNPGMIELPGNTIDEDCDGYAELSPETQLNNQGQFVSSLVHALNNLHKQGVITNDERTDLLLNAVEKQKN